MIALPRLNRAQLTSITDRSAGCSGHFGSRVLLDPVWSLLFDGRRTNYDGIVVAILGPWLLVTTAGVYWGRSRAR